MTNDTPNTDPEEGWFDKDKQPEPEHYPEDPYCKHCGSYNMTEKSGDLEESDESVYWMHCNDCGRDE